MAGSSASLLGFVLATAALVACSREGASTASTATTTASTGESETTVGTDTDDSVSTTDSPSGSFYGCAADFPEPLHECDLFMQDCPEGEKCVYFSSGAELCVPVQGDGQTGEPCTLAPGPTDDCDEDNFCWPLLEICAPLCMGTRAAPICPAGMGCVLDSVGLGVCVESCDPLLQDCERGVGCSWLGEQFACMEANRDKLPGDPCFYEGDCAVGSACVPSEAASDCPQSNCCAAYCDLDDPDACAVRGPDPTCVAFFADEMAPAGLENLGLCLNLGA